MDYLILMAIITASFIIDRLLPSKEVKRIELLNSRMDILSERLDQLVFMLVDFVNVTKEKE